MSFMLGSAKYRGRDTLGIKKLEGATIANQKLSTYGKKCFAVDSIFSIFFVGGSGCEVTPSSVNPYHEGNALRR